MHSYKVNVFLRNSLPICIGTAIYAFGLYYFVISNELMEGGITGIALLLNYAFEVPPSATTLVLNIPLFWIGWRVFGKQPMINTMLGTVSLAFFLWVMETLIHYGLIVPFITQQDFLLAALYAGVTLGTGLGIVFRFGGTTGGSDIIAQLGRRWKGWSMGQVILAFDAFIILAALFYIPQEKVLYTMVSLFISSRLIDYITEGAYAAKSLTIITQKDDLIVQAILQQLSRGATLWPGKGAYSGESLNVIYCVVSRQEIRQFKRLIHTVDPHAFVIVGDVQEVLGEGFKASLHE